MSKEVGFNPYDTVMKTPHGKVLNWMGFFPDIEAQTTKGTSSSGTSGRDRVVTQKKFITTDCGWDGTIPESSNTSRTGHGVVTAKKFDDKGNYIYGNVSKASASTTPQKPVRTISSWDKVKLFFGIISKDDIKETQARELARMAQEHAEKMRALNNK